MSIVTKILGLDAVNNAAGQAADMAQFNPYTIQSGLGVASVDKDNRTISSNLSPEALALQNQLLGISSTKLTEAGGDFGELTKNISSRLRDLAAPKEAQDRKSLESRLFKQGLLSSTEGADRFGTLLDSQALAEALRNIQAVEQAQSVQNQTFNQGITAMGGATAIDQAGLGLVDRAIAAGNSSAAGGAAAGQFLMTGAQATSDFWNSIIGGAVQGATTAKLAG